MKGLCGTKYDALERTFDAQNKICCESFTTRHSCRRRIEYTQQHFLMKGAEFVYPQRDDKAEFWDISALTIRVSLY